MDNKFEGTSTCSENRTADCYTKSVLGIRVELYLRNYILVNNENIGLSLDVFD